HSPQVEPVQPRLREAVASVTPRAGEVPFYSTVTGEPVVGAALGPGYWETNVRAPVVFVSALRRLLADGFDTFLEISPHPVLPRPVVELAEEDGHDVTVLASMRRGEHELRELLVTLGELYASGAKVDWPGVYPGRVPRVSTPPHGWTHRRFPIAQVTPAQ